MILARVFTKIYKENGIILIDANGQKYICGNPRKENPITVKLLKKNLMDSEFQKPVAARKILIAREQNVTPSMVMF